MAGRGAEALHPARVATHVRRRHRVRGSLGKAWARGSCTVVSCPAMRRVHTCWLRSGCYAESKVAEALRTMAAPTYWGPPGGLGDACMTTCPPLMIMMMTHMRNTHTCLHKHLVVLTRVATIP